MEWSVNLSINLIIRFSLIIWEVYGKPEPPHLWNHRLKRTVDSLPHTGQLVRLVHDDNGNVTSGRIEVYLHGRWGHICADKWDKTNASVICKELGFLRGAAAISAHYVSDLRDSDILTDGLRCPTDASEIESCEWLHSGGCQKNEVAGVVCHEDRGCYSYDGSDYRGTAAHTEKGVLCIKWTDAPDINPSTYPAAGLGDHNFCRNPDGDDRPWCWTSTKGDFGFCAIPRCTVDQNAVATRQSETDQSTTDEACDNGEFSCADHTCISSLWHCDMEPDCQSGEDEENCDYKLNQFIKTNRRTIRYHAKETYVGTTNESCARLCMNRENYVCRSFSFSRRTRECRLSDKNSLMVNPYPSRREDYYEVRYYLDDCVDMFKCKNGRCIGTDDVCNGFDECRDLSDEINCVSIRPIEIRLVGGGESTGTVEVNYLGQWGVICDDKFDDKDAEVICRMLGFEGPATAVGGSYYGLGTGRFLLDEVKCLGNESSLDHCAHNGWTIHDCHSWEVAGVQCSPLSNLQVELIGGEVNSGRIELVYDGIRGTICDDNWDDKDARVICRMLGYNDGVSHVEAQFGAGTDSLHVLLDEVDCSGDEESVVDCAHTDWLVSDCTHAEDAGVTCYYDDYVHNASATSTTKEVTTPTVISSSRSTDSHSVPSTTFRSTPVFTQQTDVDDVDSSTLISTTPPSPQINYDCYNVAADYRGTVAQTETGEDCQLWSRDSPHRHKYHDDHLFPDGVSAANKYCRSPDKDSVPWCYTRNRRVRWGYCDIPKCGVSVSMQNQNISCGSRPLEAGRYRRDVNDELEDFNNTHSEDELQDIDTSVYRKFGKIIGGRVADYGMHPWQAGIRNIISRSRRLHKHHCGATIIDEYWVLSAAHCFSDLRNDRILVRTGDHNNMQRDLFEQEFEAEEAFLHAGYNPRTYDYDIALVKLRPINGHGIIFNDHVQPACLPFENAEYEPGKKCHISGWGTTEDDLESAHLNAARVPIVDDLTCNRLYKWTITGNMVCAGYIAGGIDSCTGDSGGPLVCETDGSYTIMGITSFGEGCAVANAPGVYTRVTAFLSWIKETVNENS